MFMSIDYSHPVSAYPQQLKLNIERAILKVKCPKNKSFMTVNIRNIHNIQYSYTNTMLKNYHIRITNTN